MTYIEFIKFIASLFVVLVAIAASFFFIYKLQKVEPKKEMDKETKRAGIFFASLIVGGICLFISLFLKSVAFFARMEDAGGLILLILSFFIDVVIIIMLIQIYKNWPKKQK